MSGNNETRKLKIEIDNFVFYRNSKVGLIVCKTVEPLISKGQTFLDIGVDCKVKFDLDCVDLSKLAKAGEVDLFIKNSCEEKFLRGSLVKQFTLESVDSYIENADDKRKTVQF